MSASPRKLLKRAQDAFEQLREVLERHPEAQEALVRDLGPARVAALDRAAAAVDDAVRTLDERATPPASE